MTSERLFKAAQRVHGDTSQLLQASTHNASVNMLISWIPDTLKSFLKGFHLVRIFSQAQMIAFIYSLSDWLESHPTVYCVLSVTSSCHSPCRSLGQPGCHRYTEFPFSPTGSGLGCETKDHGIVCLDATAYSNIMLTDGSDVNKPSAMR